MFIPNATTSVGLPVASSADTKSMFSRLGWTMHSHSDRCTAWSLVVVARSRGRAEMFIPNATSSVGLPVGSSGTENLFRGLG